MLSSSVVVAVCLLLVAEAVTPNLDELRNKCRDEHHLLEEQVSEMNKTRKLDSSDQNVKCFIKCMMVGFDIMTEDGEITPGSPPGRKYNSVFPCRGVTGSDTCEKAVNLQRCMWNLMEKEERDESE